MPRPRIGIHSVYIADGFADDCDELIHRCSRANILTYKQFCNYYKELNFASLYQGRTSNAEIGELSEEVLQIAKYYMVLDTSNFEATVAGLFLVYALLNLQPYPGFAPLRITPEDVPALARIEQVARRDRRLDVIYILGSLLIKGPVHYHVVARERGLEAPLRKYLEGTSILDVTGVRPKGVYFRQNEELDIFREMTGLYKQYSRMKKLIPALQTRGVNYANDNLAEELSTSLKKVINGTVEDDADSEPKDHYTSVQEIKVRAMRSAISRLKHLEAAELRIAEKSPQQNEDTAQTSATTTSPKKPAPKRNSKRKRRRNDSSSSSSDDEEFNYSSEEEEKVKKPYVSRASKSFVEDPKEELEQEPEEQEINVQIDSLPPLITTETDGKLVQIEIIDEMKNLELAKVNDKKKEKSKRSKGKTDDEIFKKPLRTSPRLRVATRREMKQPILKSKFKRMGMLDIADLTAKNIGKPPAVTEVHDFQTRPNTSNQAKNCPS